MPENLPRTLLVITIIVAVAAVFLGVRDYFGRKRDVTPAATAPASTAVDSNSVAAQKKKTTSARTRRARVSSSKTDAGSNAATAACGPGRGLTNEEVAKADANAIVANDDSSKTALPRAAHQNPGRTVLAQRPSDSARKAASPEVSDDEVEGILSHTDCVPLPNLTQPGDVDAPYYQNWAREYGCLWNPK